jgi:hypothetical protein
LPGCTPRERTTVSVDCPDPFGCSVTTAGPSVAMGVDEGGAISSAGRPPPPPPPAVMIFWTVAFKPILPENSFRLVSVRIDVALVPTCDTSVMGLAIKVKSVT